MEDKTEGQRAFEDYSDVMGGVTYDGKPIPGWKDVTDKVRNGWEVAAKGVKKRTERSVLATLSDIFNEEA